MENAALTIGILLEHDAVTCDFRWQYKEIEQVLHTLGVHKRASIVTEHLNFSIANLGRDSVKNVWHLETFSESVGELPKLPSVSRFKENPRLDLKALDTLASLKHQLGAHDLPTVHKSSSSVSKVTSYELKSMVVHENHIAVHEAGIESLLTLLVPTDIAEFPANMLNKFLHAESAAFKMSSGNA